MPSLSVARAIEHQAGDLIAGRYRLERRLGEGGMGVVWVARSTALDVDVALKLMRREVASKEAVERMAREARAAAQLGHPALVRVLDFGTSEAGDPFLAMELLAGEELHVILKREQRLAAARAAALLLPIIDGLGTAHSKGIVHRDVKPENVFIARDEQGRVQPKVLDFGIAKLDEKHVPSRLTQVGAVLGSPQYFSPEQAEGLDDVDFRTDIWSVGVMLYELVTGTPPFKGSNYNALIRSILRDEPAPTTQFAAGDAQFWTIIARCLKKDPAERWGSMWELGEALALWLFERGERVDASSRSLRHGWLDGGITGLQILVPSEAPASPSTEPPPDPATTSPRALAATSSLSASPSSLHAATVLTPRRARARRTKWLMWAGVGALLVAGAVAARALRREAAVSQSQPLSPISSPIPAANPMPEETRVPAVASIVASPSVSASAATTPALPAASTTRHAARSATTEPSNASVARPKAVATTPAARPHEVFGF